MNRIGPPLPALTRRLTEIPSDFLGEPRLGSRGTIAADALLNDVLTLLGAGNEPKVLEAFGPTQPAARRNACKLGLIAAWALADEWLTAERPERGALADFLLSALPELAAQSRSDAYVLEPDRREEFARTLLARLGFRPDGETVEQATDRLSMISASERARLLKASRAAEERAREVREALARKAAQESADKWTRD